MNKKYFACLAIAALLILSVCAAAYAETTVNVTIKSPFTNPPEGGAKGLTSNGHYAGEIPIIVNDGTNSYPTLAFCKNFDGTIYVGSTYGATLTQPTDNDAWKAIAYILTWYNPSATNTEAAINAVAVWRLLDTNYIGNPLGIDTALNNAGINLADNIALGKDVARQGDTLTWVLPVSGNAVGQPGDIITFQAKLADSSGNARPNARILFDAELSSTGQSLNSYLNPIETFTDNKGLAQFTLTVPADASQGSQINVEVNTIGVWPQEILDLTTGNSALQDLIGLDTPLQLTTSVTLYVQGTIFVLPETPLGALSAVAAVAGAFIIWNKAKPLKHQKQI